MACTVITCDFSLVTRFKRDRRTEFGVIQDVNYLYKVEESLSVGGMPWYPLGLAESIAGRFANAVTSVYLLAKRTHR